MRGRLQCSRSMEHEGTTPSSLSWRGMEVLESLTTSPSRIAFDEGVPVTSSSRTRGFDGGVPVTPSSRLRIAFDEGVPAASTTRSRIAFDEGVLAISSSRLRIAFNEGVPHPPLVCVSRSMRVCPILLSFAYCVR